MIGTPTLYPGNIKFKSEPGNVASDSFFGLPQAVATSSTFLAMHSSLIGVILYVAVQSECC